MWKVSNIVNAHKFFQSTTCVLLMYHMGMWKLSTIVHACFYSVTDRNVFEMTEKNEVISVRMYENTG